MEFIVPFTGTQRNLPAVQVHTVNVRRVGHVAHHRLDTVSVTARSYSTHKITQLHSTTGLKQYIWFIHMQSLIFVDDVSTIKPAVSNKYIITMYISVTASVQNRC